MVVWVFAGGGETELKGLIIFLQNNFPKYTFERKTPIDNTKPGPRPGMRSLGHTRKSLVEQIRHFLFISLNGGICDKILILDDSDCHSVEEYRQKFMDAALEILNGRNIPVITAFASPEIEAWLIADWKKSFERDIDLRKYKDAIRRELIQKYNESNPTQKPHPDIDHPESFSFFNSNKNACNEKLSEIIQDIVLDVADIHFSKKEHSGRMLKNINVDRICEKCPSARDLLKLKA